MRKDLQRAAKRGRLCLVASPDGAEGSVSMNADARLFAGLFDVGRLRMCPCQPVARPMCTWCAASLDVNGQKLTSGDAALIENEERLRLANGRAAEVLVFDLEP